MMIVSEKLLLDILFMIVPVHRIHENSFLKKFYANTLSLKVPVNRRYGYDFSGSVLRSVEMRPCVMGTLTCPSHSIGLIGTPRELTLTGESYPYLRPYSNEIL
jgi:hypothetical protein